MGIIIRGMPRENLVTLLRRHNSADAAEEAMLVQTLAFVEAEPQCLDAAFEPGHITGSAWIVDGGSVLLTHHRKLDRWFQLGGHLEPGETVAEGALREAVEESGLAGLRLASEAIFDVDVHLIPERGSAPAHLHHDIRFLIVRPAEDAALVGSSESRALAWVRLAETHRYNSSESIQRMVRKTVTAESESGHR